MDLDSKYNDNHDLAPEHFSEGLLFSRIAPAKRSYRKMANTYDGISAHIEDRNVVILVGGSYKLA